MNYKEYQELSSKTFAESGDETLNLLHCAIGASTEVGELLDAFKKNIYYKKELDVVNVGEEIADIQWYLFNLCRLLDLDMEKLLEANIAKLKARYGDKFSTERAVTRNLENERIILEDGVSFTESRESLDNGGLKPPANNWISFQETITEQEKEILKKELAQKFEYKENVETDILNGFNLEDIAEAFSYLEEFDGDFTIKLVGNMEDIEKAQKITNYKFNDSFLDNFKKANYLALVFYDYTLNLESESDKSRFFVILKFDKLTGILNLNSICANESIISLEGQQLEMLNKYLQQHGIEYGN